MAYTPPVGTADLSIGSVLGYTPPVGNVHLVIGHRDCDDRQSSLAGTTVAPTGEIQAHREPLAAIAGTTAAPTGAVHVCINQLVTIKGQTAPPSGAIQINVHRLLGIEGQTATPSGEIQVGIHALAVASGLTAPPAGSIAAEFTPEFHVTLAGTTAAPSGAAALDRIRRVALHIPDPYNGANNTALHIGGLGIRGITLAGTTAAPSGEAVLRHARGIVCAGTTAAPSGAVEAEYDPNLLSAVVLAGITSWQEGAPQELGARPVLREAQALTLPEIVRWQPAAPLLAGQMEVWQWSVLLPTATIEVWEEAEGACALVGSAWQESPRLEQQAGDAWQAALGLREGSLAVSGEGPALILPGTDRWQEGLLTLAGGLDHSNEGPAVFNFWESFWQRAGYPSNAANPRKDDPRPYVPYWGTWLRIRCPLPGTTLHIGRTPCVLVAEREVTTRRTYMSTNSASLVRWPDLTPLPVIAMSVETDFDSWCWGLSATLAGPEAWPLVQPNPLACEVLATINGTAWKFLLDVPSAHRSFNSDRVTLKGRSRSAWLHDPYTPSSNRSETEARDMTQLAEAALDNTGWTLDWRLSDWTVPAGRYVSWNTPIGALIRLVSATDDGLYTDPDLQVIAAVKRWPVASWLLDSAVMDLLIPESAVISMTQTPIYSTPLNGIYVSGTSHGVLALVKIAGTDGALQPPEPIVNELLCDEAGVAARARGLNALSDSGSGWELDAEVLFTPEVGLVRPGLIVSIAGVKGISRSCRIQANWSSGGLAVRQSVGLERREVESA